MLSGIGPSLLNVPINAPGTVTIDMKGFTLNSPTRFLFQPGYVTVDPTGINILSSNVTVRNGTISGFWNGVSAGSRLNGYNSQTGNSYFNDKVGNQGDNYTFRMQGNIPNHAVYTINVTPSQNRD